MSKSRFSSKSVVSFELAQHELALIEDEAEAYEELIDNRDWAEILADSNPGMKPVYYWPVGADGYRADYTYVGNMVSWSSTNGVQYVDAQGKTHTVPLRDCSVGLTYVCIYPESRYDAPECTALEQLSYWHADDQVTDGWDVIEA